MNTIQLRAAQAKQFIQNNLRYGENRSERADFIRSLSFAQKQAVLSVLMPDGSKVWGIDISHWNLPPVDLKRMVEQYGLSFVGIKGCDGSLNTKYYPEHVAAAKLAGIPWLMYVWLYRAENVSIDAQTTAWSNRAKADPPPMGVFVDAEWTKWAGAYSNPTTSDLQSAEASFKAKYTEPAGRYTAPYYATQYLKGFDFSIGRNWIAEWGVDKPVTWPYPYELHQFTDNLDGKKLDPRPESNASLDGNYFNGTAEQFKAKYGGVTPPPVEEDMKKFEVVGPYGLNLRPAIGTNNTPLLLAPKGSLLWGTMLSSGWVQGTHYQAPGGEITALNFYCSGDLYFVKEVAYTEPTPPPVGSLPEIRLMSFGNAHYPPFEYIVKPKK